MGMDESRGLGDTLRGLRLEKGLSLDDIAFRTKVRKDYLQALEEGRYDLLPAETYLKGFLVSYANAVDFSSVKILDLYSSERPDGEVEADPSPAPSLSGNPSVPSAKKPIILPFLLILLVAGLAVWWFMPVGENSSPEQQSSVVQAPELSADRTVVMGNESVAQSDVAEETDQPVASEPQLVASDPAEEVEVVENGEAELISESREPGPVAEVEDQSVPAAPEPSAEVEIVLPEVMQLRAIDPVTVEVAIDDRPVQLYNLQAESLLRWRIRQSVVLEIERPDAVEVHFGDHPVKPDESGRFVFPPVDN